jgi:hypothetical protein
MRVRRNLKQGDTLLTRLDSFTAHTAMKLRVTARSGLMTGSVCRYPASGAVTSGAVYGRRLQSEPGIPVGIAGIGPYLPPNVHVPPGGLGGFGRKLTSYYE